jgi:hypothetical protein
LFHVIIALKRGGKMNRKKLAPGFLALIFVFSPVIPQTRNEAQVSIAFAILTKSIQSKDASVGDQVTLRNVSDVIVDKEVIIPKDATLLGHVAGVASRGKDQSQTRLAIIIDKAIKTGSEIPLQAIIAAVAAPQDTSLTSDPTYGMMHSNEPSMAGVRPSSTSSSGELSASSKASATAAVATANIKGVADRPLRLNEDSQGAIGYEGLSLSWQFTLAPPITVFSSKSNNVKLLAGTQVLLRMVPPRLPH